MPVLAGSTAVTTRSAATKSPGNTRYGCHCPTASRASKPGSSSVRAQPKAKVSATTSATSQPVLLGLSGSISAISRHIPACTGTVGRWAHMQCVGGSLQAAQRSPRGPPRARNGLELRARRALRRRETAWGARSSGACVMSRQVCVQSAVYWLKSCASSLSIDPAPVIRSDLLDQLHIERGDAQCSATRKKNS